MIYQFTADGDRLHFLSVNEGNTGNVNAYECAVEFQSQDWAGLEKFAAFKVGADVYTRLLTNGRCLIPSQALERAQAIYIGVYGIDPAAQTDKKLSTNWTVMNISEGACQPGVTTPVEPEPDVWEEYIGEIVNIRDNMTPYVGENGNWFVWDKTSQAMADSGRPAQGAAGFTPQKGVDYFTEADIESLGLDGKADKKNANNGFDGGNNASAIQGGAAVGQDAHTSSGGAVGAIAVSFSGGAVGYKAKAGDGFAGGKEAATLNSNNVPIDAIQLGTGTNSTPKTLQVYDYPLLDADGTIPTARIPQLDSKADKAHVYTKSESDMRYLPKGAAAGYPVTVSDHSGGRGAHELPDPRQHKAGNPQREEFI